MAAIPQDAPRVNKGSLYYLETNRKKCRRDCHACFDINQNMPGRIVVGAWVVEQSKTFKKLLVCCPHNAIEFGEVTSE